MKTEDGDDAHLLSQRPTAVSGAVPRPVRTGASGDPADGTRGDHRTEPPAATPNPSAYDPWDAILERIDDAAALAGPSTPTSICMLRSPDRVLEVAVPVRMDDGHVEVFIGWRIHHDTARGPAKGGIRFHPTLHAARWPPWRPT